MQVSRLMGRAGRSIHPLGVRREKEAFTPHAFFGRGAATWLSLLLLLSIVTLPAAELTPLGTLRCEGAVYVGGEMARTGSVVYSGDQR